jgi:hypothetical protein
MPHFVNQYQHGEADAEPHPKKRAIKSKERKQAEEKFQFENGQEDFGFGECDR